MKAASLGILVVLSVLAGCAARVDDGQQPGSGNGAAMPSVDLNRLEDELYRHGLAAFQRMRQSHQKDRFYSFAFFTSPLFTYVAVTGSTDEGLEQVAREYQEKPLYKRQSLEDLKLDLKWSPCDSPLHGKAEDVLETLDPLLQGVGAELDRRAGLADDYRSFSEFVARIEDCFVNALIRIDREGAFGRDEDRKNVVVNLLMGDQSDEHRISLAERINPNETVRKMKRELEAGRRLHLWD